VGHFLFSHLVASLSLRVRSPHGVLAQACDLASEDAPFEFLGDALLPGPAHAPAALVVGQQLVDPPSQLGSVAGRVKQAGRFVAHDLL
jgi:hypothetical protein